MLLTVEDTMGKRLAHAMASVGDIAVRAGSQSGIPPVVPTVQAHLNPRFTE